MAQGAVGAVFSFIIFIIVWFVFLSAWLRDAGHDIVLSGNLSGIEAFILDNLNFMVFIIMLIACSAWAYYGGSE
jgi:hypothetical protein